MYQRPSQIWGDMSLLGCHFALQILQRTGDSPLCMLRTAQQVLENAVGLMQMLCLCRCIGGQLLPGRLCNEFGKAAREAGPDFSQRGQGRRQSAGPVPNQAPQQRCQPGSHPHRLPNGPRPAGPSWQPHAARRFPGDLPPPSLLYSLVARGVKRRAVKRRAYIWGLGYRNPQPQKNLENFLYSPC
jgi:hypothetical protein